MRLIRVGEPGAERPGVLIDETRYVDVGDRIGDFTPAYFADGGLDELADTVEALRSEDAIRVLGSQRIGPPISRPHQILCVGLNYSDHAAETGQSVPAEPILFNKAPNTLQGPYDDLQIPPGSTKTDWEVELGVVIGRSAYRLADEASALDHIAGYVLVNDVSEREWQIERGGQWVKGKSAPTFNPAGPWLVTRDEIPDVSDLGLWLDVDGVRAQTGSTSTMLFGPAAIVHYASQFMRLEPGDLINTGTPPGVGMGQTPPRYLSGGETLTLGVDRLGAQRQRVLAASKG